MGWIYSSVKPTNVKQYLMELSTWEASSPTGISGKALDCAIVNFRTAYLAVQISYPDRPTEVVAFIYLLDYPRPVANSPRGMRFGYKDMDETMGPCEARCPKRILDLLTPLPDPPELISGEAWGDPREDHLPRDRYEYARTWRARCWANLEARKGNKAKRVLGVHLVPKGGVVDMNGLGVREFVVYHPWGHPPKKQVLKVVDPEHYGSVLYRMTESFLNGLEIKQ